MGRPKKLEPDIRTKAIIKSSGEIGCTREETAALLGVCRLTLRRFLAEYPEIDELFESGIDSGKATLRRWQWKAAKNGNTTMLIWLGKQMLKQRDDVSQIDTNLKDTIDTLRSDMERKLSRLIDEKPEGELAKEPKPE